MFFNRQDIDWFKPVELSSKYGRRGKKEPYQLTIFFLKVYFGIGTTSSFSQDCISKSKIAKEIIKLYE